MPIRSAPCASVGGGAAMPAPPQASADSPASSTALRRNIAPRAIFRGLSTDKVIFCEQCSHPEKIDRKSLIFDNSRRRQ
ncbi:MAG TPA: hypothetical protein VE993_13155 [Stellaceae bacterium]|nr:hypothetical protein [Stellaceae bacterium]